MLKARFLAVSWTLILGVVFTALGLYLAAYLTDHLVDISLAMQKFGEATTVGSRGWAVVIAERWPEVAGMIVGQLVLMIILVLVKQKNGKEAEETRRP